MFPLCTMSFLKAFSVRNNEFCEGVFAVYNEFSRVGGSLSQDSSVVYV